MQIKSLRIKNFRKFKAKQFQFVNGLNLIVGPNEVGKSTLAQAIMVCLYGEVNTKSKAFFSHIETWHKSEQQVQMPVLEMEFVVDKQVFFLKKDFEKKSALLTSEDGEIDLDDPHAIQDTLYKITNIPLQEIYESTGFIHQEDIVLRRASQNFLSAIQNAASETGSDGNAQNIIKDIEKELQDLQRGINGVAKNPGEIKRNMDRKSELQEKIQSMKQKLSKVDESKQKISPLSNQVDVLKHEIALLERLINNNKCLKDAIAQIQKIDEEIRQTTVDIDQASDFDTKLTQTQVQLAQYKHFENVDIDELVKKAATVSDEIKLRNETIQRIKDEIVTYESIKNQNNKSSNWIVLMGVFGLIVTVVLYFIFKSQEVLIVGGMATFMSFAIYVGKIVSDKTKVKIQNLKRRKSELKEILDNDELKLEKFLGKYNLDSKEQLFTTQASIRSYKSDILKYQTALNAILRGGTMKDIKSKQINLLMAKKEIEVGLNEEVKRANISDEQVTAKIHELESKKVKIKELERELVENQTRLGDSEFSDEDVLTYEIELSETSKNLDYFEHKVKVLDLLRSYVEKSIADTASLVSSILEQDLKKYLKWIIGKDKYSKFRIDQDLNISIFVNEVGNWINPVENLSIGTLDQIHFLIRFAFFKLLTKDKTPFLILDDPFVSFDRNRLINTIDILKKEAKDYQILLFTHDEYYKRWGNVIEIKE